MLFITTIVNFHEDHIQSLFETGTGMGASANGHILKKELFLERF